MNKKLIQKADLLSKIGKDEIDSKQKVNENQLKKEEEKVEISKNQKNCHKKWSYKKPQKVLESKLKLK